MSRALATQIRYVRPEWKNAVEAPEIGSRETRRANTANYDVMVDDARAANDSFGLESSGFMLQSGAVPLSGINADRKGYRQQMLDLVRAEVGALETVLLADLVRTEDQSDFNTAYARFAHCDYNSANLDRMSLDLLKRRGIDPKDGWVYAWYNTWQPFDNVVRQNPLAMLDLRSIAADEIIEYRYTGYQGLDAKVAAPVYAAGHRWYYYPDMATDEVLLSKQLESRPGRTQQCPHTSVIDSSQPDDVPARRSIETRILAIFES